ncbi:MAG: exopolysaccharide biosynthesis protein [Alphaproteobacteria bacterium]|nr:exopolysaccharide biosynthesis protein [Alphaproteobacteria bacterium]
MDFVAASGTLSGAAEEHIRHRPTSEVLLEAAGRLPDEMTLREVSECLGDRGLGLTMLLLALCNSIPLPIPGVSTITGIPLMIIAAQLMLGRRHLWLPQWLAQRKVKGTTLRRAIEITSPWLARIERYIRPRMTALCQGKAERACGGLILILALLIALPIPLGNLPAGLAMSMLSLAIVERDGGAMIVGWLMGLFAICFVGMLVGGYGWLIWQGITLLF